MMNENREYRSLGIGVKPETSSDEPSYIVEGYATTFDDPYELYRDGNYIVNEVVSADAFKDTDFSDVVFQINHSGRVYARTRNKSIELEVDEHGLKHRTNLGLTSSSKAVFEDVEAGLYDRMSFAFTVAEDSYLEENLENGDVVITRTINKVGKVYDISVVDFPANPNTDISARSKGAIDGVIKRLEVERLQKLKLDKKKEEVRNLISKILGVEENERN